MSIIPEAYKRGDYWTNLLDSATGEVVTYEVRDTDIDGTTVLDDSRCDGVLYRKTPDDEYVIDTDYINTSVINVRRFGAKGDGIADDTTAIQAALDSAPNKGIVYFPAGVYHVYRQINLPLGKELVLRGVGRKSGGGVGWSNYNGISMIVYMGTNVMDEACFKSTDDSWRGTIKYLGIHNGTERTDIDGVSLANFRSCTFDTVFIRQFKTNLSIDGNGWYGLLKEVTLLDAWEDNFYMTGIPNGMTFRDCRISRAARHGIYFLDARSDLHFYNCYLENNGENAIKAERAMVLNISSTHFESNSESWSSALDDVDRVHIRVGRGSGAVTHSTTVNITSCHFFTAPAINIVGLYSPTGSINSKMQLVFNSNNINTKSTTEFGTDTYALIVDGPSRAFIGTFINNISSADGVGRIGDIDLVNNIYRYTSIGCELSIETLGPGDSRMAATFSDVRVNRIWLPQIDGDGVGGTNTGANILAGSVHPEDNIEATPSSIYIRNDSSIPIEDRIYIKSTGATASGWVKYKSQRVETITSGDADDFEDGSIHLIKAADIPNVDNLPDDQQDLMIFTFVESEGDLRSRQIAYSRRGRTHVRTGGNTSGNRYVDGWTELSRALTGNTASRPTVSRPTGTQYFDTDINQPVWWDGADWVNAVPDIPDATTSVKGIVNQSAASADTAAAVGATYDQGEVQAIITELRDLKTKMRAAGLLDS